VFEAWGSVYCNDGLIDEEYYFGGFCSFPNKSGDIGDTPGHGHND